MITLREAATQALEALEKVKHGAWDEDSHAGRALIAALRAALAEPTLQTCNCRWDGEVQVQQCTLHEAHVDAIKEWAQRAKFAEKKLAALAEPAEPLTVERLRDALVASRIIPPAAVEEPDEYDDGVTLHRIEALHRRLT